VEAVYESLEGVEEALSGYAGGKTKNPTYYQVITGKTGHAETVEVIYDSKVIDFVTLVEVFFDSHDPTLLNQQGPDRGTQYRSVAFYQNESEKKIIEDHISKITKEKVYPKKIVTEVRPLSKFYYAEKYHQDYEKNNPKDLYILNVSKPRLNKFKAVSPELLKKDQH
jgi:peptide-methionine (S)-S-oxide reductase